MNDAHVAVHGGGVLLIILVSRLCNSATERCRAERHHQRVSWRTRHVSVYVECMSAGYSVWPGGRVLGAHRTHWLCAAHCVASQVLLPACPRAAAASPLCRPTRCIQQVGRTPSALVMSRQRHRHHRPHLSRLLVPLRSDRVTSSMTSFGRSLLLVTLCCAVMMTGQYIGILHATPHVGPRSVQYRTYTAVQFRSVAAKWTGLFVNSI